MADTELSGRRILVVEDEYLIADDICAVLNEAGAEVLGPAATTDAAAALIASGERIDGALLDINLRGTMIFDIADSLAQRGIPFVFATGYDRWAIPERFDKAPRMEKPIKLRQVVGTLEPLMPRVD